MNVCKLCVHTQVRTRLDYCNALCYSTLVPMTQKQERLPKQAAMAVCKKYNNVLSSVTELTHWLLISLVDLMTTELD